MNSNPLIDLCSRICDLLEQPGAAVEQIGVSKVTWDGVAASTPTSIRDGNWLFGIPVHINDDVPADEFWLMTVTARVRVRPSDGGSA